MDHEAEADPTGETRFGITVEELRGIRNLNHLTIEDLRKLTREEAREIYRIRYWNPLRCDDLPAGVDLVVLDFGAMSGLTVAAERLQLVVGAERDSAVGPATLAATKAMAPQDVVTKLSDLRLQHLSSQGTLSDQARSRITSVKEAALKMVAPGNAPGTS
jgi:lysozyme family protein